MCYDVIILGSGLKCGHIGGKSQAAYADHRRKAVKRRPDSGYL